jgi:putative alpha-1,2-mannosidase
MEIHQAEGFTNYTIFSLWDTYRAEHPLLNLIKPKQGADMAESMIRIQQQSALHLLPVWYLMANEGWCMSGYHSVAVLSDVAKKLGIKDKKAMLEAMQATATSKWMEGMTDYIKYGYVPYDRCGTSASNTLEYAYDDWTIYQAALDAGNKEMAETFKKRALNYKNVFNPELVKMLQGGEITYDSTTGKFKSYTPPVAGSEYTPESFTLNLYTAHYDASGLVQGYEKVTYPNCTGNPVAFAAEDDTFAAPEYTINSAPSTGAAPYTIEYVSELPTVVDPDWA